MRLIYNLCICSYKSSLVLWKLYYLNYLFACASDLHYFWVEHWEYIMWFIIYDYRL